MDYDNIKCPVCNKQFTKDDDIVVCPECGTPHHRECYEINNSCFFEEKHKDGFVFGKDESKESNDDNNSEDTAECPKCKTKNPKESFYCSKCGFPLKFNDTQYNQQNNSQGNPTYGTGFNGTGFNGANIFDPMAGVNPEYKLDNEVTAGEAAKFVQKNTQYFMRVFYGIKEFARSRFNFSAFLFSGGYLLYRKMYKLGAIFSSIMFFLVIAQLYIQFSPVGVQFFQAVNNAAQNSAGYAEYYSNLSEAFLKQSLESQILLIVMVVCSLLEIAIRIFVGIKANRWYLKHTTKEIKKMKSSGIINVNNVMESKGGVNTALAFSMLIVYLILMYLPYFL